MSNPTPNPAPKPTSAPRNLLHQDLNRLGLIRQLFFRDDDADSLRPELTQLLSCFSSRAIPLSLAVIPGTLQPDAARLLARQPESISLHQHGWMHTNHEKSGRKCEFGPSRTLSQQLADIAQGQARLNQLLPGRCTPVFTPPWNRCTQDTFTALHQLGFAAVSLDRTAAVRPAQLPEISVSVDLFRWKNGPHPKSLAELEQEILLAWQSQPSCSATGLLLHHKVMDRSSFALLETLLDRLRAHPLVRFTPLEAQCSAAA